jgi:hypothetical protein
MINLLKEYLSLLIETNLAPRHMYKPERWKLFHDKIINGEYFDHVDGRKFKIDQSNVDLLNAVENLNIKGYRAAFRAGVEVTFQGKKKPEKLFHPSHIKKTPEFGGADPFAGERDQIKSLEDSLSGVSSGRTIRVKYSRRTNKSKLVNGVTKSTGKSDVALTFNGAPQIQVSLKHANAPNQMMQWGGLSRFRWSPEVTNFINKIRWMEENNLLKVGTTYYRPINDLGLKKRLCYGNNAHVIVIGGPNISFLQDKDGIHEINGHHVFYKADNDIPTGDWEPCLVAFYSGDRSDFSIEGFRLVAWPTGKITNGRPV